MREDVVLGLLKRVSRSFYISLRLLPKPMREGAAQAYLLARATDSIADSSGADRRLRLNALDDFASRLAGQSADLSLAPELVMAVEDEGERQLLGMSHLLIEETRRLPEGQLDLINKVMATIISGQRIDLELFADADRGRPVVIGSARDLDDYTYRVAGCVGEFWTRLGFETLGSGFSNASAPHLVELGVNYGKGLQLVNILRDLPRDLEAGRCYLPVTDPHDREALLEEHQRQCGIALVLVRDGLNYADQLSGRRLRAASVMPALLAEDTLELLRGTDWTRLERGLRISRSQVYRRLMQSFLH